MSSQSQTMHDHVAELRFRLSVTAVSLMIGGSIGYILQKPVIRFLSKPVHETLYFNSPAGGFNFVMKICFIFGLVLALPVLVFNVIRFIQPAFSSKVTTRHAYGVTALSMVLAIAGALFAFFLVIPLSLHFFQGFQTEAIKPLISASEYLKFVTNCVLSFMVIFQIPLIVLFINRIKPIPPRKFLKYEKYVIIGSLAVALILPFTYDPVTQFVVALPIIILYNFSALMVALSQRKRSPAPKPSRRPHAPIAHATKELPAAPLPAAAVIAPVSATSVAPIPAVSKPVRYLDIKSAHGQPNLLTPHPAKPVVKTRPPPRPVKPLPRTSYLDVVLPRSSYVPKFVITE